jgi:hypothetical protein
MGLAHRSGHDPLALRNQPGACSDEPDDIFMRAGVGKVDQRLRERAEVHQVGMSVDEPGQEGRAAKVDDLGVCLHVSPDGFLVPDRHDPPRIDRERRRDGAIRVARDDLCVCEDGSTVRKRRYRGGHPACRTPGLRGLDPQHE